jgi:hypothetical protein
VTADPVAWDIGPDEVRIIQDLPVPAADLARACAHDLMTSRDATGHVERHLEVALAASPPVFDLEHAHSHVNELTEHLDSLTVKLRRLAPAAAAEIDLLSQAMRQVPAAEAPAEALPRTCAHLLTTARVAAGHVRRHLDEAMAAKSPESVTFNITHSLGHAGQVREHLAKLTDGLRRYIPAVGREVELLEQASWADPAQAAASMSRSAPADYDVTGKRSGPEPA